MSEFKKHILIIEDEVDIAELLEFNLEKAGYQISVSENGESGLDKARNLDPDLILLDLMLPGIHGLDVCRILKSDQETEATSIIILTALGQEENIVKGLEAGADDYVTKPFSLKVLLARIQSVLRRGKVLDIDSEKSVHIENISIRPRTREVMVDKRKIDFTFTEFEILYLLASHPGWVFTRYQMIDKIRGDNYPVTERSIDFQIVGLRKNLGDAGNLIETIRGVGYRFKSNDT
ncbi:MAG: response regulator [Candidatus Marinimicrobia bacterium]|nr:response regulator [Candidatus Neomarinimicrobiota bacterium]